jgi:hypothetical protein
LDLGGGNPGREESQQFIKKYREMCEERDTTFGCHWENIERLEGKENLALYRATNLLLTV